MKFGFGKHGFQINSLIIIIQLRRRHWRPNKWKWAFTCVCLCLQNVPNVVFLHYVHEIIRLRKFVCFFLFYRSKRAHFLPFHQNGISFAFWCGNCRTFYVFIFVYFGVVRACRSYRSVQVSVIYRKTKWFHQFYNNILSNNRWSTFYQIQIDTIQCKRWFVSERSEFCRNKTED